MYLVVLCLYNTLKQLVIGAEGGNRSKETIMQLLVFKSLCCGADDCQQGLVLSVLGGIFSYQRWCS